MVLIGEAYFEVFHNQAKPFIVESNGQRVEVLGTHFNINGYADEGSTRTTLLEGAVRVSFRTGSLVRANALPQGVGGSPGDRPTTNASAVVLKPGQQSEFKGRTLHVRAANTEEALAWKNGYFNFDDENMRSIMRKVSRWYNIEVVYEGDIDDSGFTGAISRNRNISQVLEILSRSRDIRFKIEGRRVIVIR